MALTPQGDMRRGGTEGNRIGKATEIELKFTLVGGRLYFWKAL